MVLVVADADGTALREMTDFELEQAWGDDENSFALSCSYRDAPKAGQLVFADGGEIGGIVDEVTVSVARGAGRAAEVKGRTWHGVLANKVLVPDAGKDYLTVSGTASAVLASLFSRMGLSDLFAAEGSGNLSSYSFERFVDAYTGIRALLKANGMKLRLTYLGGKVRAEALPVGHVGDAVDSDLLDFDLTQTARCTNHLVCAGKGDLAERTVVHLYADAAGNVSKKQTLFGVDEVTAFYDYSSAEADELEQKGVEKLSDLQNQGGIEVDAHSDIAADVGDSITAQDNQTGLRVTAEVVKKVVKATPAVTTYGYEVGGARVVQRR